MNRSENMGTSTSDLTYVGSRSKLREVVKIPERKRRYDRDGRIVYPRGYSQVAKDLRVQSQRDATQRHHSRHQSRWTMESQACRLSAVSQLSEPKETRQKIKPATCWPTTIENLVAFRLSASVFQAVADNPQNSLPVFSIALPIKKVKAMHRRAR